MVAVNLLGTSNECDRIDKMIKEKDMDLFADNCESMWAKVDSTVTGNFGIVVSF